MLCQYFVSQTVFEKIDKALLELLEKQEVLLDLQEPKLNSNRNEYQESFWG
jgi:hypothetical protein